MNVEDLVRERLHQAAEQIPPIADLPASAVEQGRRRRALRRAAVMGGVAMAVAVSGGAVALVHNGGGSRSVIRVSTAPPTHCPNDGAKGGAPWWDAWADTRQQGRIDSSLVAAASRYWYGVSKPPEPLCVYAGGTTPDGSTWIMYTASHAPHLMQWLQGLDGLDIDGHYEQTAVPDRTWSAFLAESVAGPHELWQEHRWLIIVGKPGTTQIDYSDDGSTWRPLQTHDGIAVAYVAQDRPPAASRIRLHDKQGVYAEGTPPGADT
ncbi:MAG TPA: hypothetical protein VHE57_02895 [Mycobacteriales bacterium]|nr:hypothetical protein [Mycobacteriales bacterium]